MKTDIKHGGKREGAGRKKQVPEDAKKRGIMLTNAEYEKVLELLKSMRG